MSFINVSIPDDPNEGIGQYHDFLNGYHSKIGSFLHEAVKVCNTIVLDMFEKKLTSIFSIIFQHGKKDVVRALLNEGSDPGLLDEVQDTAVDLINSPEMKQVFSDVLMQAAAHGK